MVASMQALVGGVHADEFGGEDGLDVFDGLEDAFAEVVALVAVAEFDGFVLAGGGAAGNGGAAHGAAGEDDFGFDGGVSAGIEDFAGVDGDDLSHVAPIWLDGAGCCATTRCIRRSLSFGRRSTGTVRPPGSD